MTDLADDPDELIESKSSRKRAAHAAQDLGSALIALTPAELDRLALPEALHDAVLEAQRLTSRAALARQRQYIGKLMRHFDVEAIEAALEARHAASSRESARQQQIERWRTRLIAEGDAAIDALFTAHCVASPTAPPTASAAVPAETRARIATLVATARSPRGTPAARTTASRSLFRELRALLGGD
jgi:ribosome-associated protein